MIEPVLHELKTHPEIGVLSQRITKQETNVPSPTQPSEEDGKQSKVKCT